MVNDHDLRNETVDEGRKLIETIRLHKGKEVRVENYAYLPADSPSRREDGQRGVKATGRREPR